MLLLNECLTWILLLRIPNKIIVLFRCADRTNFQSVFRTLFFLYTILWNSANWSMGEETSSGNTVYFTLILMSHLNNMLFWRSAAGRKKQKRNNAWRFKLHSTPKNLYATGTDKTVHVFRFFHTLTILLKNVITSLCSHRCGITFIQQIEGKWKKYTYF